MSDPAARNGRRNISQELWEIVETLSDDAQRATLRKAKELGFELDKGTIPFEETLVNLTNDRDVLKDAIEKSRLPQLPLKVQEAILTEAKRVSTHLVAIANGTDAVIPLESSVEDLTASVWYSGLHNLTGELLGLQKKLNQIKTLESSLGAAKRKAEEFIELESKATAALGLMEGHVAGAAQANAKISETVASSETAVAHVKEIEQQAGASYATIQQNTKNSTDNAATIAVYASETEISNKRARDLLNETESLREAFRSSDELMKALKTSTEGTLTTIEETMKASVESIRKVAVDGTESLKSDTSTQLQAFIAAAKVDCDTLLTATQKAENDRAVDARDQLEKNKSEFGKAARSTEEVYKEKFLKLEESASKTISENDAELTRLTTHLTQLEDVIREKIELATNYQLFHSFQTRQHAIEKSKNFWAIALATCVALSAVVSIIFICYLPYVKVYNAAFYMKLSISLPIIYAITFCSIQFSRERRLEEEYAFKANISISLDPYRKLVAELVDKDNPVEMTKYADFVIESINRVFTSPTSHSFDEKAPSSDAISGVLKEVGNIMAPFAKALQK